MAYALRFNGNERVDLSSLIELDSYTGQSWRIELKVKADTWSGAIGLISGDQATPDRMTKGSTDAFLIRMRTNTNTQSNLTSAVRAWDSNNIYTLGIHSTGASSTGAFRDGVDEQLVAANRRFNFLRIGDGNTTNLFSGLIYEVKVFRNGALANHWLNTSGIGNEWTDIIGGNNGSLVNFPTDNSQWVFYDDGGAANESTVSYDLGAIDYAVSSQITAPAISATVSYDIGEIDYAVSAQQLAPGNNASLSYDIGAISYAVSAQSVAPHFSASVGYEIGSIGFAVQANTGIPANAATAAYDLGGIGYSVSAQSVAPQLSASLTYDIGGIDYAISANTGTPIRAATVGYEIGDISWQVNAQWQPSDALVIIGYDIGSIGFLVQARSGDVVVSSASDSGLSFKELARGLSFKEQPRGVKFTEPPRGVRV